MVGILDTCRPVSVQTTHNTFHRSNISMADCTLLTIDGVVRSRRLSQTEIGLSAVRVSTTRLVHRTRLDICFISLFILSNRTI